MLQDNRPEGNLQLDDDIVIPQDDLYVITWETNFGDFPNSKAEVTIPTPVEASETPNGLGEDPNLPGELFANVDPRSTGPHQNEKFDSTEKHAQNARMTGLMINNHQKGAILSCPKYQTMKMMI